MSQCNDENNEIRLRRYILLVDRYFVKNIQMDLRILDHFIL